MPKRGIPIATDVAPRPVESYAFEKKPFYAPKEVAEIMGCSKQHVLNEINAGKLYARRISARVTRVPLAAFIIYLGAPPQVTWIIDPDGEDDGFFEELERKELAELDQERAEQE